MWKLDSDSESLRINYNRNLSKMLEEKDFFETIEKYDFLNKEFYLDAITPANADKLDRFIRFWNKMDKKTYTSNAEREPIKIYIDSFGGSLSAAFTIIDSIKLSKTPVYTINIGTTQKESFYIFLAGLKRYSYPRATFYWNKSLSSFINDDGQSNFVDFQNSQEEELKDMLLEKTKFTENDYEKYNGKWLTAEKAYSLNICNEVLRNSHV